MHQNYALWFVLFGTFVLLFFLIASNRATQMDKEWTGDPAMLTRARKARRAPLIGTLIMAVGSWIIAAMIYANTIDIGRLFYTRSFHFYLTSFVLLLGLASSAFSEWKLRQFAKRIESSGDTDEKRAEELEMSRKMRWKLLGFWVLTFVIVLLA